MGLPQNSGTSVYYTQEQWDETGEIPDDGELKAELKGHERYTDLHSQSSQRVLEELAEAFNGWFSKRRNGDNRARPPGYRKNGDSHPLPLCRSKRLASSTTHSSPVSA